MRDAEFLEVDTRRVFDNLSFELPTSWARPEAETWWLAPAQPQPISGEALGSLLPYNL